MAGNYRIYAVRYARRDTNTSEVFYRDTARAPIGMDYFVWALPDGARTVVVDLGFTEGDTSSLLTAMREQLGLVATPASRSVTMLVVSERARSSESR